MLPSGMKSMKRNEIGIPCVTKVGGVRGVENSKALEKNAVRPSSAFSKSQKRYISWR